MGQEGMGRIGFKAFDDAGFLCHCPSFLFPGWAAFLKGPLLLAYLPSLEGLQRQESHRGLRQLF